MKKRIIAFVCAVILCVGLFYSGVSVGAASSGAGTIDDPLITKSYLELRLGETGNDETPGAVSFTKVTVAKGKRFYASEGTEFVLYSGGGSVVGEEGLLNLTTGEQFKNGNTMVKYSLFLSPGADNGIKATSAVTLFVKGSYTIE